MPEGTKVNGEVTRTARRDMEKGISIKNIIPDGNRDGNHGESELPFRFHLKQYALDQRINDMGIESLCSLVQQAIGCDKESHDRYMKRAQELTGLKNPNSSN